jgi:tetratricopeptide (TPR) repeat protein/CHAT domain-containing protein
MMKGRLAGWFGFVLAWALASGVLRAEEPPALTGAEQQLLQEAAKLGAEGMALSGQSQFPAATERLRKALELLQRVYSRDKYPDGHPNLAACLGWLGFVRQAQGEYDQAEPLFRQALAMYQALYPKAKYPDGHPHLASTLSRLGVVLQAQGRYAQAEPFFRQTLQMYQALYPKARYPDGHPDLTRSLSNLGFVLKAQGAYGQAEPYYHQALAMNQVLYPQAKYPDGHPELAQSLNEMGSLLQAQGKYGQAEPFYRQALAMRQALYPKEKYPDGHPDLAASLSWLGSLHQDQGAYGQAESFYRQALAMHQALYPKDKYPDGHAGLATSLNNLGLLLKDQGEYGQAEPFLRQALAMTQALYPRARYPDGHPDLANRLNNLGLVLQAQGEYGQAEPFYRQALAMNQALYPKDKYPDGHPHLAASLNNLGFVLQGQGEYRQAEPLYRQALEMCQALYPKATYPDGNPELTISLNNLGGSLWAQGAYGEAEPFYRQALAMTQALYPKARYPDGHPHLARSLSSLGASLEAQGEYGQAKSLYRQAVEMTQALYPRARYPDGHPDLALRFHNLGSALAAQGEYGQAEFFLHQAMEQYTGQANRLAQIASEPVALNAAATFPLTRDLLLSVTGPLPDRAARTYDAVWHSRASITRVYQRRHLALLAAATDAAVRRDWDELQQLRRQREQLIMAPASAPAQQAARQDRLDRLNAQLDQAEKALRPRLPVLPYYEELAKRGPDALQRRLAPEAVFVDLLRYTHLAYDPNHPGLKGQKRTVRYLAFVVTRAAIQRVELGRAADLDAGVQQWRQAITQKLPAGNDAARRDHDAQLRRHGQRVRDLVWEPVEKCFPAGVQTVFVAPDGELTQLPWAALPGGGPDRVLLDDYALAVVPHGPYLLEQLTPPPARAAQRPPPAGLLLVGGIRYDDQPVAAVAASRGAEGVVAQPVTWGYLPGTRAERELLENLLAKTGPKLTAALGGVDASTARLRQELERARYAHLATHGFFADKQFRSVLQLDPKLFERRMAEGRILERRGEGARSPLVLSGLVCSGANRADTPERGILSADAVAGLLLDDLQLAVLSACDTGLGDVAGGEGVFGLQRAFHIAGCHNVVASLWKVDDAATAALMARFYGYLFAPDEARRLPPLEALRRAQLDLYRHPELIPAWSRGEDRAPGKPRLATAPPPADTPPELLTSAGRAPIKLWAAFALSGLGR